MVRFLFLSSVLTLLIACGETHQPEVEVAIESKTQVDQVVETAPVSKSNYGEFTKNTSTMPIVDTHAIWLEDENKLKIYLTPSPMTEQEKERLAGGEMEFFVFSSKPSPDESKWQWYPYVVTELRFESDDIRSQNIKSFYILAYGIEEQNYTDNLNSYPNEKEQFNNVSFENGHLTASYFGSSSIMESRYQWKVEI